MNEQHTPGPWEWIGTDSLWGGRKGSEEVLKAADDGKPYGMHSPLIEHHWDSEQAAANRRLIAAAPDLLAALQAIISDGVHCDVVPHLHRQAVAAIAKAEGAA